MNEKINAYAWRVAGHHENEQIFAGETNLLLRVGQSLDHHCNNCPINVKISWILLI